MKDILTYSKLPLNTCRRNPPSLGLLHHLMDVHPLLSESCSHLPPEKRQLEGRIERSFPSLSPSNTHEELLPHLPAVHSQVLWPNVHLFTHKHWKPEDGGWKTDSDWSIFGEEQSYFSCLTLSCPELSIAQPQIVTSIAIKTTLEQ